MKGYSKDIIARSFSRAAQSYDANAELQREVAAEVAAVARGWLASSTSRGAEGAKAAGGEVPYFNHSPSSYRILDVGCGTGELLRLLRSPAGSEEERFSPRLHGCDISSAMLEVAAERVDSTVELKECDFESLPYEDESFDLLISSLAYQWSGDLTEALKEASRVLKRGGLFVASIIGDGSLEELTAAIQMASGGAAKEDKGHGSPLMTFYTTGDVEEALTLSGLSFGDGGDGGEWGYGIGVGGVGAREETVIKHYPDMWSLMHRLKGIGAMSPYPSGNASLGRGSVLKGAARYYSERFPSASSPLGGNDGGNGGGTGVRATYNIIYASGLKE